MRYEIHRFAILEEVKANIFLNKIEKKRTNISESSNENIPSISKIKKKKYKRKKCKFLLDEAVVSNDSFNSDSDIKIDN